LSKPVYKHKVALSHISDSGPPEGGKL